MHMDRMLKRRRRRRRREREREKKGRRERDDRQDVLSANGGNDTVATSSLLTSINIDCDSP